MTIDPAVQAWIDQLNQYRFETGVQDLFSSCDTIIAALQALSSGGGGGVTSVNGQTGVVVLTASDVGAVAAGPVTTSGLTEATNTLLGRTSAGTGAIEQIAAGSGLTLSGGSLSVTNPVSIPVTVPQGGTGVMTLTGLVKGNGAAAFSAAVAGTDYVAPGPITTDGITISAVRLAGRTSAGTGAVEEIAAGSGLTLSGGSLSVTNPVSAPVTVPQGGTGVTTLTGLAKGNGAAAFSAATPATDYVAPGAITTSGLTQATARLLGRTTAGTGAVEEISAGSGLSLAGGSLSVTNPVSIPVTVPQGGTGLVTIGAHTVLLGNGTSAINTSGTGATGMFFVGQSSADPIFTVNPHVGTTGNQGTLNFDGGTSGVVTVQVQAAAGTYNFNLPTTAGSSGQPLLSGGGGTNAMTFGTLGVAGGGTGLATLTAHALYVGNGTSAPNAVGVGATGTVLAGSTGADPTFTATPTVQTLTLSGVAANTTVVTESGYSLTGANAQSLVSLSGTLNTSGSPDVLKLSITNTAAGAATTLLNLYAGAAGATSVFSVDPTGVVTAAAGFTGTSFTATGNSSFNMPAAGIITASGRSKIVSGTNGAWSFKTNNNSLTCTISFPTSDGTLQLGSVDAAAPVAQTLSVQNVIAGTSNTPGQNWTLAGSKGTGTGAGGSIIFQTAAAGTTGTSQNALATRATIDAVSGVQIQGTTTNNNASAGNVGEFIDSTINTPVSLTTATQTNIASISLTAGDWDVNGAIGFTGGVTTVVTQQVIGISTTSATLPTSDGTTARTRTIYNPGETLFSTGDANTLTCGPTRISLSATTTVYLVGYSTFTTSTQTAIGEISARRVR